MTLLPDPDVVKHGGRLEHLPEGNKRTAYYRSAFRSSDCCQTALMRVIETTGEFFVCLNCERVCKPVERRL
jgi:hypothetical protein